MRFQYNIDVLDLITAYGDFLPPMHIMHGP